MNRHLKISFFLAPFLILGGYVLSDLYVEDQASQLKLFQLKPKGACDVIHKTCQLHSGKFELNVMHENGISTINSTFPLDTATLFLVDEQDQATAYQLGMKDTIPVHFLHTSFPPVEYLPLGKPLVPQLLQSLLH